MFLRPQKTELFITTAARTSNPTKRKPGKIARLKPVSKPGYFVAS
jgi:hypothetical protein